MARSKLGSYYERFPDWTNSLFEEESRVRLVDLKAVCPPTPPETLHGLVDKHVQTLPLFLSKKPIAAHTLQAFRSVQEYISENNSDANGLDGIDKDIVLDSGCGTGRSTLILADKYPDCIVIGVDRSLVRLTQRSSYKKFTMKDDDNDEEEDTQKKALMQIVPSQNNNNNAVLIRAELSDFWRCVIAAKWKVRAHYLLYPNPYPKIKRVKSRWYGHPSFPILLGLKSDVLFL